LLRHPRGLLLVAVVARVSRNVTGAMEISVVGAKHRASWRNRFLTCLVTRGRGPILISRFLFFCSFSVAVLVRPSSFHASSFSAEFCSAHFSLTKISARTAYRFAGFKSGYIIQAVPGSIRLLTPYRSRLARAFDRIGASGSA